MNPLEHVASIVGPAVSAAIHPFEQTISVVGPIVGAIILLVLFAKLLSWIGSKSPKRFRFKGVLDEARECTVHLANGTSLEHVRLLGFIDSSSEKGAFPYELHNLLILEHSDRRRTLIPAKSVRMIEVPPSTGVGPPFGRYV